MRRITILLVMLMALGLAGIVSADDSIDLLVTPGVILAVAITETSYNFGTVNLNSNTVSTEAVTVDTTGANVNQKLVFNCANSANWTIGAAAGTNIFEIYGKFDTSQPSSGWIQLPAASTDYDSNETDVPKDTQKDLWFQLQMPTDSGTGAEQTIAFTVKGVVVE